MPNFRRYYIPDTIVFITGVTNDRKPYLHTEKNVNLFWDTMEHVQSLHPFNLLAYVILPEHFHWLMRVNDEGGNFSKVLHSIKRNYTINFKKEHEITDSFSLWQNRFWDHIIRDEQDLKDHFDYIHWNPVKHSHVQRPEDWPQSTYHFWLERDYYSIGWGWDDQPANLEGMDIE